MRRLAVGMLAGFTVASCSISTDTLSFTPPVAVITQGADCMADNIFPQLGGGASPDITPAAPAPGYPPKGFEPVEVVRCERAVSDTSVPSVDAVHLTGDVHAVLAAFSLESKRLPPNVQVSCAYQTYAPVAVWLVDRAGRAFRAAWPEVPCGFRDEPLPALTALHESSRSAHPSNQLDNSACAEVSDASPPTLTTADDVARQSGSTIQLSNLASPTTDAGPLNVCRFTASTDDVVAHGLRDSSAITLTSRESVTLMSTLDAAPLAGPCRQSATRLASLTRRRADGSGGSSVTVELDGCQRAMGNRATPTEVIRLLSADPR